MIQLINRRIYTERIAPFINKNIIKVLTGQRRVGKSCILRQIQNQEGDARILRVALDDGGSRVRV